MEQTKLTNLNQKISRVGLGTWSMTWSMQDPNADPQALFRDSYDTIRQAIDMGINFIDTAPIYGFGSAELIVGQAVRESKKRDFITIATKAGVGWREFKEYRDSRRKIIYREVENSLYRLQTDYIDLYQIHWPDPLTELEETATTCRSLLEAGKIRAVGLCNFSTAQIGEFKKHCPVHCIQSPFNIFEHKIEKDELPFCVKNKISVVGYSTLCRGLLNGAVDKYATYYERDPRKEDPKFQEPLMSDYLDCTQKLEAWVKEKYQRPLNALAIRWALDRDINIALVGARKPQQLDLLKDVWGWKLTPEDFTEIDQIVSDTISNPVEEPFEGPPNRPDKVS